MFATTLLLAACGDDDGKNEEEESTEANAEGSRESEESGREDYDTGTFEIGAVVNALCMTGESIAEIEVKDFYKTTEIEGESVSDIITKSPDNAHVLGAEVRIKNVSDEPVTPSLDFGFTLKKDGEGALLSDLRYFPEAEEELAPGKEVKGTLMFIPTSMDGKTFTMALNQDLDAEIAWEFEASEISK